VTKCPSMGLSRSALSNLESSYALFKSVSHNPKVAKILVCFFVGITERFSSIPCVQPVLGRLVKRAVASMEEYQSKKTLPPRLTIENVDTKEDEEALSSALGGTTRRVPHKQGSNSGSYCGTSETESMPPSSPRGADSPSLGRVGGSPPPQHTISGPTTTLANTRSPIDSPRMEWQNTWGQVPQNAGHSYSVYPTNITTPQWTATADATAANWYNAQFHDPTPTPLHPQHTHSHYQQKQYNADIAMGDAFPSFGQTSSTLGGGMSWYSGAPQQAPQPQNNVLAYWQNLSAEMGASSYP
jgi:hypothetical protein